MLALRGLRRSGATWQLHTRKYATDELGDMEKKMELAIELQKKRIQLAESVHAEKMKDPWSTIAIMVSGVTIALAWRMVSEKNQHQALVQDLNTVVDDQAKEIARLKLELSGEGAGPRIEPADNQEQQKVPRAKWFGLF